jgi:glutamine synthetase type III
MDFMKSIRSKLSARQADAQENYCSAISEIATGKMSDRAAIEAVDALVELLPQTGKTADDLEERAADLADAEHAAKEAAVAAGRVLEEAEELRQQADAMVRDADERRSLAASKVHAARAARSEAHSIRRQLAARGWPGPQAAPAVEVPQ